VIDSYTKAFKTYSRARVPHTFMREIGFEDCDYVSDENSWTKWLEWFEDWDEPIEFHVPCREPVDHLLSQCNHKGNRGRNFRCEGANRDNLIELIEKCLLQVNKRFSYELLEVSNFHLKCYRFEDQFTKYLDFLETVLQSKKRSAELYPLSTNVPRNRTAECLLYDESLRQKLHKLLVDTVPYYQFCDECLRGNGRLV